MEMDINFEDIGGDNSRANGATLTGHLKEILYEPLQEPQYNRTVAPSEDSILTLAAKEGLTLKEFVEKDPQMAVKLAEASFIKWTDILSMAAIEGAITDVNGDKFAIGKAQVKMIQLRMDVAKEQLDTVREYAFTAYGNAEQRQEHLLRVMYDRAIKGDSRLLTYLVDRVDGKPVEMKATELDYDNAYNIYQIIHTLFDKQLEVLNAGNGTVLVCCSRRAGKTHMLAAILLIEALRRPNTICIYIGETMELSEQLLNTAYNQIIATCQLKDKRGRPLNWKKLDNGSLIMVRGLSNTKDPDQIRGNKAKVIVIDEFFHLKSELLSYLQTEVLQPMQMDYADDYKFICAGTPPSIKGTFGEQAWKSWDCAHFYWTWEDNPFPRNASVEQRREYVEKVLAEKGLDWTSPFARREYLGEWIYDEDLLLYPVYHTYDPRESIPNIHVDMVLFGIDYGVSDNDTLWGIAWDSEEKAGFIFCEEKFNRLDLMNSEQTQLDYLKKQCKYYWMEALDFFKGYDLREANKRILWDADDNDQHVTDELRMYVRLDKPGYEDLKMNIGNAHKTDKVIMQEKIRDLLRTGGILLPVGGKTAHECDSTVHKRGPNGEVLPEIDDKVFHPDLLPAMRYAMWNVLM